MSDGKVFIHPFSDFGFKTIFGEERNSDILKGFLNELLAGERAHIKTITYLDKEQLPRSEVDRKAIYDVYCEDEKGDRFIRKWRHHRKDCRMSH